jgi:hypothetical protein
MTYVKKFDAYHDNLATYDGQTTEEYRIEIEQLNGAAGSTEIEVMGTEPVRIQTISVGKGSDPVVVGSELIFTIKTDTPATFDSLFESEYKDWRISYYKGMGLIWRGYVQPENLSRDVFEPWTTIEVSATDALKDLSETEFRDSLGEIIDDKLTPMEIIKTALDPLGIELDFIVKLGTYETTLPSATLCLTNVYMDTRRFDRLKDGKDDVDSCLDVLEKVLKPFHVVLRQSGGAYRIQNQKELNSPEHYIGWDLVDNGNTAATDVVNIDTLKNTRGANLSKVSPTKILDITYLNRNLGLPLVDDLNNFATGTPWTFGFSALTDTDTGAMVTLDSSIEENESNPFVGPDTWYMELTSDFEVEKLTENDTIVVSFMVGSQNETGIGTFDPGRGAYVTTQITSAAGFDETHTFRVTFGSRESRVSVPVSGSIGATGFYNVRIKLILIDPEPTYYGEFVFKNFDIRRYVEVDGEQTSDITFDRLYRVTSTKGKLTEEKELVFGDSGTSGDIGRLTTDENGASGTVLWNRYGKTDSLSLVELYALDYLSKRSTYLDYLQIGIYDFERELEPHNIVQYDSKYYTFKSYSRSYNTNYVNAVLQELVTTDVSITVELTDLTSVDGVSRTGSNVVIPSVSNSVPHRMDDAAYHRTDPSNALKMVTWDADGKASAKEYVEETIWHNINSSMRLWGGEITDNLDGSVTVAAGAGLIKTDEAGAEDTPTGINQGQGSKLSIIEWAQDAAVALTDQAYNYIYIDETGAVRVTTDFYSISFTREFTVGRAYRDGTDVVVRLCGTNAWNFNRRVQLFGEERFPVERATGLILGETGTRNVTVTAGILWAELVNRFSIGAIDTSLADTFTYWHVAAGTWTKVLSQTQISNTHYNNIATGLVALTGNQYAVHWVWVVHDGSLHIVYGRDAHPNIASAEAEPKPTTLPGLLSSYGSFIGRIIIQRNAASFASVSSAFDTVLSTSGVTNHNDLAGLQGGQADEYYHLTGPQHTLLTDPKETDPVEAKELDPIEAEDFEPKEVEGVEAKAADPVEAKGVDPVEAKEVEGVEAREAEAVETKPADPVEVKEADPVEVKPADPVEAKETTPIEAKETTPIEGKEADPVEVKETDPVEAKETEPIEAEDFDPKETDPVEAKDVDPVEVKEAEGVEAKNVDPVEAEDFDPKETDPVEAKDVDPVESKGADPIEAKEIEAVPVDDIVKIPIPKPKLEIINHAEADTETGLLPESNTIIDKIRLWWEQDNKQFLDHNPEIWLFREKNYQRRKIQTGWIHEDDPSVGVSYGGGYFLLSFMDGDGKKWGVVVAEADADTATWGCSGTSIDGTSTAIGAAEDNTAAILSGCSTAGIAARVADGFSSGGKTDWVLPSRDTLAQIYAHRASLGTFSSIYYWSSSQASSTAAWAVGINDGGTQAQGLKTEALGVRPVRYELMSTEGDVVVQRNRKKKWTHEPHLNGTKFPLSAYYAGEITHPIATIQTSGRETEWALTATEKVKQEMDIDPFEYFVGRKHPLTPHTLVALSASYDYADTDNEIYAIKRVGDSMRKRGRTHNQPLRFAIVIDNPDATASDPKLIGPLSDIVSINPIVTLFQRSQEGLTPFRWYVREVKWTISHGKRQKH